ncbi:DUF6961 family protein [Sphingomonas spermidinifaciens]|uniref:DUF6961 family protein n=1 Tax=Sphingomonas spermidinifaciens TaxID=1141889 RepID=UPI003CCBEE16
MGALLADAPLSLSRTRVLIAVIITICSQLTAAPRDRIVSLTNLGPNRIMCRENEYEHDRRAAAILRSFGDHGYVHIIAQIASCIDTGDSAGEEQWRAVASSFHALHVRTNMPSLQRTARL